MAELCAFGDACPVDKDITDISGVCSGEKGAVCGPAIAYSLLVREKGRLAEEDEDTPIVGSFKFTEVPAGDPPQEIRGQWVGVEVPVRHPDRLSEGGVEVSSDDVELSLLSQGRLDAASWFISLAYQYGDYTAIFQVGEGEVTTSAPIASVDYYGSRLSASEVRVAIEDE